MTPFGQESGRSGKIPASALKIAAPRRDKTMKFPKRANCYRFVT
jgi:hypothetical protein